MTHKIFLFIEVEEALQKKIQIIINSLKIEFENIKPL
jgi:hypothetical protein